MALDRKDVRAKLDPEVHAALKAICDLDGVDIGDFIEALIVPAVQKRVHDAMMLADKLQRLGLSGSVQPISRTVGNSAK